MNGYWSGSQTALSYNAADVKVDSHISWFFIAHMQTTPGFKITITR